MPTWSEALATLEHLADLARAQNPTDTTQIPTITAQYPTDPTLLHKAGVVHQLRGEHPIAISLFHRALAAQPGFPFSELELGTTLLWANRPAEALPWLLSAAAHPPTTAVATPRAALLAQALGHHAEALPLLRQAHQSDPTDAALARALGQELIYHDRRPEAAQVYTHLASTPAATPPDHIALLYLLTETAHYQTLLTHCANLQAPTPGLLQHATLVAAHARLAQATDRPALLAAATARESAPTWLDPTQALARLHHAVTHRHPLALIRLGDGEGRFLAATSPDLPSPDAQAIGQSIWHNWFGTDFADLPPSSAATLRAETLAAIAQADILGIPTAARLHADNLHFGYLAALEPHIAHAPAHADASLPLLLHAKTPHLRALLAGLDTLAVISPHPGLAARLARALGIPQAIDHLIPGEQRLPPSARRTTRPHYPDTYDALMRTLAIPHPGAVFLIAAGLLGKSYAARIKALGGIAIDIGSMADAWMGYDTRPGLFPNPETWRLPP